MSSSKPKIFLWVIAVFSSCAVFMAPIARSQDQEEAKEEGRGEVIENNPKAQETPSVSLEAIKALNKMGDNKIIFESKDKTKNMSLPRYTFISYESSRVKFRIEMTINKGEAHLAVFEHPLQTCARGSCRIGVEVMPITRVTMRGFPINHGLFDDPGETVELDAGQEVPEEFATFLKQIIKDKKGEFDRRETAVKKSAFTPIAKITGVKSTPNEKLPMFHIIFDAPNEREPHRTLSVDMVYNEKADMALLHCAMGTGEPPLSLYRVLEKKEVRDEEIKGRYFYFNQFDDGEAAIDSELPEDLADYLWRFASSARARAENMDNARKLLPQPPRPSKALYPKSTPTPRKKNKLDIEEAFGGKAKN